jgi:hypothetical protein
MEKGNRVTAMYIISEHLLVLKLIPSFALLGMYYTGCQLCSIILYRMLSVLGKRGSWQDWLRGCRKNTDNGFVVTVILIRGRPGSSVGIATGYGLDGPGIESRSGRDFPHLSRPALGPTQPPVQWVPGLSWGKERPGSDADPSPLLVSWSRKGRATPLLPLFAVRPVQSLSAL